jgi:hypothetical protein
LARCEIFAKVKPYPMKFNPNTADLLVVDGTAPVEDLTIGLEWVEWLFQSVRQRSEGIVVDEASTKQELSLRWGLLAELRFPSGLGPLMLQGLRAAQVADLKALQAVESAWTGALTPREAERSGEAGRWLLHCMRGARHAGVLTVLQEAVAQGRMVGHLGVVWPVIGAVFQLTPASVLAEYLRLEFQCASRRLPDVGAQPPFGQLGRAVKRTMMEWVGEWRESVQAEKVNNRPGAIL